MKRISSGLIIIFSLVFAVLLVNQNTTYASWLQVSSGKIGLGYSDLADTISFKEYDKTIKIKIGNHLFNNLNTLYIYKDDQKIASISIPADPKKYIVKQIEDVDTGRVFYVFNGHMLPPAIMMGYDPINTKWQVYVNSLNNSFPDRFRRLGHPSFYVNEGNFYLRFAFDNDVVGPVYSDAIYSLVWDAGANWIGYSLL